MTDEELAHVGRALAMATETLVERLGDDVSPAMPEHILATLDDDEVRGVSEDWLEEARSELERRQQIVDADQARRAFGDY